MSSSEAGEREYGLALAVAVAVADADAEAEAEGARKVRVPFGIVGRSWTVGGVWVVGKGLVGGERAGGVGCCLLCVVGDEGKAPRW